MGFYELYLLSSVLLGAMICGDQLFFWRQAFLMISVAPKLISYLVFECPFHATCIHETDLQSVWPGVLSLDTGPMCVTLGFNVILAVVR